MELIKKLRRERPSFGIYLSTSTLAGRATAEQRLAKVVDGIFFAPLDYRWVVRRVLRKLQPVAVVILETEIWPNLFRESKRAGASLLIINARISDRALPSYLRSRPFFQHVLNYVDLVLAQSEQDAKRYVATGAPADRVLPSANLKYDFRPPEGGVAADIAEMLDRAAPGRIWVAASTDAEEEDDVIGAFQALSKDFPRLLTIMAPRKPERFDEVAKKLERAGVSYARRSAPKDIPLPGILLLDSIGELAALFERANVVFMGGTLAPGAGMTFWSQPIWKTRNRRPEYAEFC